MHVVGELPRDIDHVEMNLAAVPLLLQENWRLHGVVPGTLRTMVRGILVQDQRGVEGAEENHAFRGVAGGERRVRSSGGQ